MAWTTFGTEVFGYRSLLTSQQMQQLRDNVYYLGSVVAGGNGSHANRNLTCRIIAPNSSSWAVNHIGNFAGFTYNGVGQYTITFSESYPTINDYGVIATVEVNTPSQTVTNTYGIIAYEPPYSVTIKDRALSYLNLEIRGMSFVNSLPVRTFTIDQPVTVSVVNLTI
jgi:hypothetical protein